MLAEESNLRGAHSGIGAKFDGGSEADTPIRSLVDPLRDLPKVALKAAAAERLFAEQHQPVKA